MTAKLGDYVLDYGLTGLVAKATHIHITDADPASFADVATMSCGNKDFGAGQCFTDPVTSATPPGRLVMSSNIMDGNVTRTTRATGWAVVDAANAALLANGTLNAPQDVVVGNTFQLSQFTIIVPNGA